MRSFPSLALKLALSWVLLAGGALPLQAATFELKPGTAEVSFDAIGRPSALKIHGTTRELTLKVEKTSDTLKGFFEVPLQGLDSGIALRDRHMKDKYLEVEKHPVARLEFSDLKLPALSEKEVAVQVPSKFTLHGVTQPLDASVSLQRVEEGVRVRAELAPTLSRFGIEIPKFAGITVAEEVKVRVDFVAVER